MARHPEWDRMATDQKLEFLHEWADNVSKSLQTLETQIRGLDARLRAAEEKGGEKS